MVETNECTMAVQSENSNKKTRWFQCEHFNKCNRIFYIDNKDDGHCKDKQHKEVK